MVLHPTLKAGILDMIIKTSVFINYLTKWGISDSNKLLYMEFFNKTDYNIEDVNLLIENEAEELVYLDFMVSGSLVKNLKKRRNCERCICFYKLRWRNYCIWH